MERYIGTSGFFYWEWKGRFYPEDLKPSKWFEFYTGVFNTVELNSTFYKFPEKKNLRRFYNQAPEGFKISLKVNRQITHEKRLKDVSQLLDRFYLEVEQGLGEKLGAILFQMPPSFRFTEKNIERVQKAVNPDFLIVFEFRHPSWWDDRVYNLFRERDIIFCSVSAPRLPEDYVEINKKAYIRFHGREKWYRYNYSREELMEWARKARSAELLYAYFNNDFDAHAPDNAALFRSLINDEIEDTK
ncbi:DUF72 domain-containing protein [Persephonella sp.]